MPAEGNEAIFAAITPRQLDVLCELAEERRHSRLATRLYVSVTTVRTHIRCSANSQRHMVRTPVGLVAGEPGRLCGVGGEAGAGR